VKQSKNRVTLKDIFTFKNIIKYLQVAAVLVFLIWYLMHPDYYVDEENGKTLLTNGRTYFVVLSGILMMALILIPYRLSDRWNRILGWCWFVIAPFAVYFSLLHMNAARFHIDFWSLNRIALALTFVFLFLVMLILVLVTGSIRVSSMILAVLVAVLGIANWYVINFRGQALSGADIFSFGTAMTVASGYKYQISWYVFSEAFCTLLICILAGRIRRFKVMHFVPRVAMLCVWMLCAGSFFRLCCQTSFLEDNDIRSKGFTHQLRYKQYDMLFTTLCTCFYLVAEKPEGYSVDKVKEISEAYVEQGSKNTTTGAGRPVETDGESVEAQIAETIVNIQKVTSEFWSMSSVQAAEEGKAELAAAEEAPENGDAELAAAEATPEDGDAELAAAEEAPEDGDAELVAVEEMTDAQSEFAGEESETEAESEALTESSDIAPETVIVIMNESFADYTDIGEGLTLSEDCMPFIHSLTEDTIKGNAYASVFGGNTANSEYEFLTGNTMGFLPASSVAFNFFVRSETPSVASELGAVGYKTVAIHPYRGTNYKRDVVYPRLGFDTFYTRSDFYSPEYIRKYISDDSLSDKIIREYKKAKNEGTSLFSYNVTIQNHGDYLASNSSGVPTDIQVLDDDVDQTRTTMYVNLIKKSDEMFEKLVNYFSDEDEKVAILMFGDHQASLGDDTYLHLLGKSDDELTAEEQMEKYKVPFIIWTNYDIEEEYIEQTSLNYLYSIMADRLGLPMTAYQQYLLDLSEDIPVLAAGGYWAADGSFYELDDEESPYFEQINDYNILEYNYIFGKKDRYSELFELQE
jgi:hypothetical protein